MTVILIQPKDATELKFIMEMLNRTKIKSKKLSASTAEDILLGEMMDSAKTGKTVSKATIMRKLRSK